MDEVVTDAYIRGGEQMIDLWTDSESTRGEGE
jgi:hypothetical protein